VDATLAAWAAAEAQKAEQLRVEGEARIQASESKLVELQQQMAVASTAGNQVEFERLKIALGLQQECIQIERARHAEAIQRNAERMMAARAKEAERLRALHEREARRVQAQREKERAQQQKKAVAPVVPVGLPDDEDLEAEQLAGQQGAGGSDWGDATAAAAAAAAAADGSTPRPAAAAAAAAVERPPFPPPELGLVPAFAAADPHHHHQQQQQHADAPTATPDHSPLFDEETGMQLLTLWSFLATFGPLLGLQVPAVRALHAALQAGQEEPLLAALHIALMRVVQADMEEAHASGILQVGGGVRV